MSTSVVAAPAKVNLVLRVLERESSGYHAIETLFCALELADELVITLTGEATGISLEVDGPHLGDPAENLAVRAARSFLEAADADVGVEIRLLKRIPAGGGLGGGSSDAAATLRALDELLPDRVPRGILEEIAAGLGSDVPFFLTGAALARGEGRGERLTAAPPLPSRPVVIAIPPFPVATSAAYAWLDSDREGADPPSRDGWPTPGTWEEVEAVAANDFERPVYRRHPELRALRDGLRRSGARVALLAGSGSTVFGIFDQEGRAERAAEALRQAAPGVRVVGTRTAAR